MILLLNRQKVMVDMIEWARLRLARVLKCDPRLVRGTWALNKNEERPGLVPEFGVDAEVMSALDSDLTKRLFETVSWEMRIELEDRLRGLSTYRVSRGGDGRVLADG